MKQKQFGILPYAAKKIKGMYLITTKFGGWIILNRNEWLQLSRMDINEKLFLKLKENDIIIDEENARKIVKTFQEININLFKSPSLHIISLTSKCNHNCIYCQAESPESNGVNLNKDGAIKMLNFVFKSNNHDITIEFQGGEPLFNWDILKFIAEEARKLNKIEKKNLRLTIVTNLSAIDDKKLDFLIKNDVSICTSLDGPKEIHDRNRSYAGGGGTYDDVSKWIDKIRKRLEKDGKKNRLNALVTITKNSLPYYKEIVEEYIAKGFNIIHLRFLNCLGAANKNWNNIGYSADEFIEFWKKGFDYILELNKKGADIKERGATIMLTKILKKRDPCYTELMSPCGAGRMQLLFNQDGKIYTCDEGRMLGEDLFMIGDINKNSYEEAMGSQSLIYICESSVMDLYKPESVFSQWTGTCPIVNYAEQSNVVVKIAKSFRDRVYDAQFSYLFEKIVDDPKIIEIFIKWVNKQDYNEENTSNKKRD